MPSKDSSTSSIFWGILAILVFVAIARFVIPSRQSALVGEKLPVLEVAGWLNGLPPEDLAGHIVVLDFWATWCGPCIAQMEDLVEVRRQFEDYDDLVFLGLTAETATFLPQIDRILREQNVLWPVAYGADSVASKLGITALPTYVIFDRSGTAVWSGHTHHRLREKLIEVLVQAGPDT